MSNQLILWQNQEKSKIPGNLEEVSDIVTYANAKYLSPKQQNQIVKAFDQQSYEMSAEFAWKKAIIKLRKSLERLGVDFIVELLGRSDINEYTPIDEFLTDRKAIDLAEQLGIIGKTGALKLRHHYELISHYLEGDADEDISRTDAFGIIYDSIQYILSEQNEDDAFAFSEFRSRLLGSSVSLQDADVQQILRSPLFYIRTVCIILLNAIKKDKGVRQEHALTNMNTLIKEMWKNLAEADKYSIGLAYSTVSAQGDDVATKGLKLALMKVHGFDYVPETTRSTTFRNQARKVIDVHYAYNNFYNEPAAVRSLEKLGSIIPAPAFQDCIDAYLCVYLGNNYGRSTEAYPIAEKELLKITVDRWNYFFKGVIHQDQNVLDHIRTNTQIDHFRNLLLRLGYTPENGLPKENWNLYNAIIRGEYDTAKKIAGILYSRLMYNE